MFAAYLDGLADLDEADVAEACRRWPRIAGRGQWWPALAELRELAGDIGTQRRNAVEARRLADPAIAGDPARWPVELHWLQRRLEFDGGQGNAAERVRALASSVGVGAVVQACNDVGWGRDHSLSAAHRVFAVFGWSATGGQPDLRVVA